MKTGLTGFLLILALAADGSGQQRFGERVVSTTGLNPAIAAGSQGDFIIVWQDVDDGASSGGVFARLYTAGGEPKGPVFLVNSERFGHQIGPKVAADSEGNFVVVWTGGAVFPRANALPGGDGDLSGVFAQRLDRFGQRRGHEMQINREVTGYQLHPVIAMYRSGALLVAWQDCSTNPADCTGLRVRRFSAAGIGREEDLEMEVEGKLYGDPFVSVDPKGFSVGWTELTPVLLKFEASPAIVRFTPDAQPAAVPPFRLFDGMLDATGWTLQGLASSGIGSVALLGGNRNSIQLFTPGGDTAGPRKIVGRRAPCNMEGRCERVLTVAMNASGHFAVVWSLTTPLPSGSVRVDLLAQFFDPEGQPLGERFQVNRRFSGVALENLAAVLADDGILTIVWGGVSLSSFEYGLVFRRFRIRQDEGRKLDSVAPFGPG